ncbi:hypothetical protein C8J57DRAFT_1460405 [Mycena rebaudengoi]|nr:hypothetical protein C8J57DRAFT_1460405 [Mycena rebaudengoi]
MAIFSPRSTRSSRIPFTNFTSPASSPPPNWFNSPFSSPPPSPWNSPSLLGFSPLPFSPSPFRTPSPLHSQNWGTPWYSHSPQTAAWYTPLPPVQPWFSPMASYPGYPPYQPTSPYQKIPKWDLATPPSLALQPYGSDVQGELKSTIPKHVHKVRIYVETPDLAYWTKQWGYITAYKRNGKDITLLDVLEAIYNYFQEPLASDAVPLQYLHMLTAAYTTRLSTTGTLANAGYGGLARMDVLNGYRVVAGMRLLSHGDAGGTMYVALNLRKV